VNCPCQTCILFAVCYCKSTIHCKDLYLFLCEVSGPNENFYRYKKESLLKFGKIFNRHIQATWRHEYSIMTNDWNVSMIKELGQINYSLSKTL